MSLTDRIAHARRAQEVAPVGSTVESARHKVTDPNADIKRAVHQALIESLGAHLYNTDLPEADLTARVRTVLHEVLQRDQTPLPSQERAVLAQQIADDILGYGPLEPLLRDTDITEIMVNGYDSIYVERFGLIEEISARFSDEAHLRRTIDKIVGRVGRRVDESSPMVDARLQDGSRVNAILPPLAVDGPSLTIRKFAADPYTVDDLVAFGTMTPEVARLLEACVQGKINIIVSGATGGGKAQPLDAKIATPYGWREMGALKVGDRVTGSNGSSCSVTGVFPQGEEDVYRITFKDGSSVEASGGHLWQVRTRLDKHRERPWRVMTTDEIAKWQADRPTDGLFIPMVEPVEFGHVDLPCDPYLLGVLLGDGGFKDNAVRLTNPDAAVVDRVKALLPKGVALVPITVGGEHDGMSFRVSVGTAKGHKGNPVTDMLRRLRLLGLGSKEKFIPQAFKWATPAERLELLRGLCDTDGYVRGGSNKIEFSTSSPRLAADVCEVVESLGGTAHTTSRIPSFTHAGERRKGAKSFRVSIKLPGDLNPFSLPRKAREFKPASKYPVTRRIVGVEFVGRKETQCISVDAPDRLYVTEHYIVTHNTTTLNVLSGFIPTDERIVTIEDAAELQLHQRHVVRLESRPPNMEGRGEVVIRDLVKNALRMRPDRIVVGEVRDAAALDMLQAMNTGHDGSISTVHSNGPRDTLARIETMVLMGGIDLPVRAIREQVASAVELIVHQSRFKDGTRHITHITEVVGMEGDIITLQDLFVYDYQTHRLVGTGLRPSFLQKLADHNIHVDTAVFGFPGRRVA